MRNSLSENVITVQGQEKETAVWNMQKVATKSDFGAPEGHCWWLRLQAEYLPLELISWQAEIGSLLFIALVADEAWNILEFYESKCVNEVLFKLLGRKWFTGQASTSAPTILFMWKMDIMSHLIMSQTWQLCPNTHLMWLF
jgi:hypothetical protein